MFSNHPPDCGLDHLVRLASRFQPLPSRVYVEDSCADNWTWTGRRFGTLDNKVQVPPDCNGRNRRTVAVNGAKGVASWEIGSCQDTISEHRVASNGDTIDHADRFTGGVR